MVFFLCYPWFLLSSFAFFWNALQRYKNILLFANNSAKIRRFNTSISLNFCNKIRMWVTCFKNVRETWGRTNVPHVPSTLYTSAFERFYVSMWGTFSIPWFSVSKLLENRNHLWFASAPCGRPFRFLLATRPHVAEGSSASFGACLCFLRATSLKPSCYLSNTCLTYYSERNSEYSWSISDYSDSIEQRSGLASSNRHHEKHPM